MSPFDDNDMERWETLDLDDRGLYDLALLELAVAGWDTMITDLPLDVLEEAVLGFRRHRGDSRAARAIAAAWFALWHRTHPHTQPAGRD